MAAIYNLQMIRRLNLKKGTETLGMPSTLHQQFNDTPLVCPNTNAVTSML